MPQATSQNINVGRRRVLIDAGAAVLAGSAALAARPANSAESDPMFAAITKHRTSWAAYIAAMNEESATETALHAEYGMEWTRHARSTMSGHDLKIVPTDNPRYIAALTGTYNTAHDADRAADEILETTPTTVAGVVAALDYAYSHGTELSGQGWPEGGYEDRWTPNRKTDSLWEGLDFYQYLVKHLAVALAEIAA